MKKKYALGLISIFILLGFHSSTSAITDPGANYGPIDLIETEAEIYDRGDSTLLKLSIEAIPHLPGVITFESDVDNSTGTGSSIGIPGIPIPPCPCKSENGLDIVVNIFTRRQGDSSESAIAANCTDTQGACGRRRESGEWYATTRRGHPSPGTIGILRGYLDPTPRTPESGETEDCYTLPWSHIIAYANRYQQETTPGDPNNFNYTKARANDYGDGKWQVSIWYDADAPSTDEDDIASGTFPSQTFDINDIAPDVGKADMIVSGGATDLSYCEGNFDHDQDVDGSDAATFKANFGRSLWHKRCSSCGPRY